MRIYLGLQGFQLVALVFYLGFIDLIDIQVEITQHVIEGDGDVNQFIFMFIINGNIGIKLPVLYPEHGEVYQVKLPGAAV